MREGTLHLALEIASARCDLILIQVLESPTKPEPFFVAIGCAAHGSLDIVAFATVVEAEAHFAKVVAAIALKNAQETNDKDDDEEDTKQ